MDWFPANIYFDATNPKAVNLVRCAWAGSQRYGALVWSEDIHSSYADFRKQIVAGLHMGMAGIPWWTTDIGGFAGGNPDDPKFRASDYAGTRANTDSETAFHQAIMWYITGDECDAVSIGSTG